MENQYFQNGQNHNEKVSELTIELDNLKNANDELKTYIEKLQAEKECLGQKLAEIEENHQVDIEKMNAITNEDENIRFQNEKSAELSVEIESLKQANTELKHKLEKIENVKDSLATKSTENENDIHMETDQSFSNDNNSQKLKDEQR